MHHYCVVINLFKKISFYDTVPKKLIASFDGGSDALCESKKIKTNITFDCYPTADWEYAWNNDASGFFGSIIVDFEDPCSVSCIFCIVLVLSLFCRLTLTYTMIGFAPMHCVTLEIMIYLL